MARQARIEYPGALYHVISRGIERRDLFRDDEDRRQYLSILERAIARFGCLLYAYCLMSNHVHLALETGDVPLSRIMRSVNSSFSGYFNRRHKRSGYLFQGRYKAFLVDEENYLLALVRYVHLNPVKAGAVRQPSDYVWSSHRSYLGKPPKWLAADEVLRRFGRTPRIAKVHFEEFFAREPGASYERVRPYVQTVVGDADFARRVFERAEPATGLVRRLEASHLLEWVADDAKIPVAELRGRSRGPRVAHVRALCGYLAREVARLPLSRVARELGRDQSTIWRDVRALERRLSSNPALRKDLRQCQNRLVNWVNA